MSTSVQPYPHISINVDDQTPRTVVTQEFLPLFRPIVAMKAYKGQVNEPIYCETYQDAVDEFGEETFDKTDTTYFTEEALYLIKMFEQGGSAWIVRLSPDDATSAVMVFKCEVLADYDVPQYTVDADGLRNVNESGEWIAADPSTATGTKLTWHLVTTLEDGEDYNTVANSTGTDADEETETVIYPMLGLKVTSPGVWGNNIATEFYYDPAANDTDKMDRCGACFYTMAPVVKNKDTSVTSPVRDIYRSAMVSFCMKPNVVDPDTTQEVSITEVLAAQYTDGYELPFEVYVYESNWETVGEEVLTAEDTDTTDLPVDEPWKVNLLTGRFPDGRYYKKVLVSTEEGEDEDDIASTVSGVKHYMAGGADGTITRSAVETLLIEFLELSSNADIVDKSHYPFNYLIDTGHSLTVKYAMIDFMSTRDDVGVLLACQDLDNDPYTMAEETAIASTLRSRCLLVPESVLFGTGCCRAAIFMGTSKPYNMGNRYIPTTLDIAVKMADSFSGQKLGNSLAGRPYSEVDTLQVAEFAWIAAADDTKSRFWNNGLNYVQYCSMVDLHWPAIRTVHSEETSALVNLEFVFSLICIKQLAQSYYTTYSNVAMSWGQLQSTLQEKLQAKAAAVINNQYPFTVTVYRTEEEEALGYVTHVSFNLIAPTTNRVMNFDIVCQREDA